MRPALLALVTICALSWCGFAHAQTGSITYRARVVHENRSQLSFIDGGIDLASGDFSETVVHSYNLDWRRMPGAINETRPTLPDIWYVDGRPALRFGAAMPRYDSQILRHFIAARIIAGAQDLKKGDAFLAGQLVIESAKVKRSELEVVALFRGMPLVIVGERELSGGKWLVSDLAVLGPTSELYQFFFDEIEYTAEALAQPPALPELDPADYVTFPADGIQPVAIRPIKDWLVFQAQLPNGRPLNLVLDSGAETMILDELVLKVDALLEPVGEMQVAGAFGSDSMNLYEGFSFEVGGVRFDNLQVAGTQLTSLGMGAGLRIHGIVGNEILQLTRLDIDLDNGELRLNPPGERADYHGEELPLTFIGRLPHVEVEVKGTKSALMMLDTGQRSGLAVNLDWLDSYGMDEKLMLNGFLGDINGGLAPRYIVEHLDLHLAGQTYHENAADATPEATFTYNGLPVVGAIGFPLLARHYGNLTFDYSNKLLYLGEPSEHREFTGRPEAWITPATPGQTMLADAGGPVEGDVEDGGADPEYDYAVAMVVQGGGAGLPVGEGADAPVDSPLESILEDPLAIVRAMAPGLLPFGSDDTRGWRSSLDPRHSPIILPDRSNYNDLMNEGLLEDDYRPSRELAVGGVPRTGLDTAAELTQFRLVAAAMFRMFGIKSDEFLGPVEEPANQAEAEDEGAGDGLGDRRADYPFKRGLPKLEFD